MSLRAGQIVRATDYPVPLIDRCTALTANTSATTFIQPTGMAGLTLAAATLYHIQVRVKFNTAVSTTGISLQLGYSGTDSGSQFIGYIQTSTTDFNRVFCTVNQPAGWASTASAGATSITAAVDGWLLTNSAGLLTLDFRSEVAASAANIIDGTFLAIQRADAA